MPYTFAADRVTAQKIREARDFLEVPICVENVSSYAEFHASEMTEWEFLTEVVELADCGILLDVNNIYVSSKITISILRLSEQHSAPSCFYHFQGRQSPEQFAVRPQPRQNQHVRAGLVVDQQQIGTHMTLPQSDPVPG